MFSEFGGVRSLTIADTAKALRVSERHVARLIAQRVIPSLKLGRRRIIREEALRQFMAGLETLAR